jgi:hypothetical protein
LVEDGVKIDGASSRFTMDPLLLLIETVSFDGHMFSPDTCQLNTDWMPLEIGAL